MYTIISRCIQLYVYQTSRIKNYFNIITCGKVYTTSKCTTVTIS